MPTKLFTSFFAGERGDMKKSQNRQSQRVVFEARNGGGYERQKNFFKNESYFGLGYAKHGSGSIF